MTNQLTKEAEAMIDAMDETYLYKIGIHDALTNPSLLKAQGLYTRDEVCEIAKALLAESLLLPAWISVKEDTPADGIYLCHIQRNNECGTVSQYQRTVENRMNKFVLSDPLESITHWMPLPTPPKPEL